MSYELWTMSYESLGVYRLPRRRAHEVCSSACSCRYRIADFPSSDLAAVESSASGRLADVQPRSRRHALLAAQADHGKECQHAQARVAVSAAARYRSEER